MEKQKKMMAVTILFILFNAVFFLTNSAFAHCDTMNGPVVAEAKNALAP